jgi:hypothetical protein
MNDPVEKGRHPSVAHHGSLDLVQCSLSFPLRAVVRQTLIRHCYDERRSCFRSAPSLSVVAVTTPQFMPGILRWGEYREQFSEGLDAGNCAGYCAGRHDPHDTHRNNLPAIVGAQRRPARTVVEAHTQHGVGVLHQPSTGYYQCPPHPFGVTKIASPRRSSPQPHPTSKTLSPGRSRRNECVKIFSGLK